MLPKRASRATLGGLLLVCCCSSLLLLLLVVQVPLAAASPYPYASGGAAYDDLDDSPERSLETAIELSELDYEDGCLPIAGAEWKFLHESSDPEVLKQWVSSSIWNIMLRSDV